VANVSTRWTAIPAHARHYGKLTHNVHTNRNYWTPFIPSFMTDAHNNEVIDFLSGLDRAANLSIIKRGTKKNTE
jgi:hypothetical protein